MCCLLWMLVLKVNHLSAVAVRPGGYSGRQSLPTRCALNSVPVRSGLGSPESPALPPSAFSFEWPICPMGPNYFFLHVPKGKRLKNTASQVQEPLLGAGGGSYSSLCLWFPHGLRAWKISHSDACWVNQHRGKSLAGVGCVGQRPLQVTMWRAA